MRSSVQQLDVSASRACPVGMNFNGAASKVSRCVANESCAVVAPASKLKLKMCGAAGDSSSDSEAGDSDTASTSSLQDAATDAASLAIRVRLSALGCIQAGARAWGRALHPFWIPLLSNVSSTGTHQTSTSSSSSISEPRALLTVALTDTSPKVWHPTHKDSQATLILCRSSFLSCKHCLQHHLQAHQVYQIEGQL